MSLSSHTRRLAIAAAASLFLIPSAHAEYLLCTSPNQPEIAIALGEERLNRIDTGFEDSRLYCIYGEFVRDMSGCSSMDGYGFSRGGQVVELGQGVTEKLHEGGVTKYTTTAVDAVFSGGHSNVEEGYQEDWRFHVSRLSGKGSLSVAQPSEEDAPAGTSEIEYTCAFKARLF